MREKERDARTLTFRCPTSRRILGVADATVTVPGLSDVTVSATAGAGTILLKQFFI